MTDYNPPAGFHFKVEFTGLEEHDMDVRFQSVSGLNVDLQTESVKEGGQNRFEHVLPLRTKYQNLTLKRGVFKDTGLINWCRDSLENLIINPLDLTIKLLNEKHEPLITWNVVHAWPVKWSVTDFDAMENSLVIETIELNYQYFTII